MARLIDFLSTVGIDPERIVVCCIGVIELDGPIYSVATLGMHEQEPHLIQVDVDVGPIAARDNVNPEVHRCKAVSEAVAVKRLDERLVDATALAAHNAMGFSRSLLAEDPFLLDTSKWLDTMALSRWILSTGAKPLRPARSASSLSLEAKSCSYDRSRAWNLEALCPFTAGEYTTYPELAALRTKALLIYLLGRKVPL